MSLKGKIVFSSGRSVDFDIWALDLESGDLSQLTCGPHWNDFPKWSPDGSRIVFVSDRDDGVRSLWLMNADGSNQRRLTHGCDCLYPSWFPEGDRIVFGANAQDPDQIEICSLELRIGAKPEVLFSRKGRETEPSLSPDGRKVVFSAAPAGEGSEAWFNTEIWEYDLTTHQERRLTDHPARDYCPVFSPDGKRVAFVSHRDGMQESKYLAKLSEIKKLAAGGSIKEINAAIREVTAMQQDADVFVMDALGSNLKQLTRNSAADCGVAWSPCGTYLTYSSTHGAATNLQAERIKVIDAGSGQEIPLQYDRAKLRREVGAAEEDYLNSSWFQRLVPDFIERKMVDPSFWGEERHPHWTYI